MIVSDSLTNRTLVERYDGEIEEVLRIVKKNEIYLTMICCGFF